MPRRRFYRGRKRGIRRSYFAHLFEVDKITCGLFALNECPIAVFQTVPGAIYVRTITDYLHVACANMKLYNNSVRCNYVSPVGCMQGTNITGDHSPSDEAEFALFLFRYWVPAFLRYRAFEIGDTELDSANKELVDLIVNAVSEYVSGTSGDGIHIVWNTIWSKVQVVKTGYALPMFYPVNKLIGHKVSNVLKRCGIRYLIHPYAIEPIEELAKRAQGNVDAYSGFILSNVGQKKSIHLIQEKVEGKSVHMLGRPNLDESTQFELIGNQFRPKDVVKTSGQQGTSMPEQ